MLSRGTKIGASAFLGLIFFALSFGKSGSSTHALMPSVDTVPIDIMVDVEPTTSTTSSTSTSTSTVAPTTTEVVITEESVVDVFDMGIATPRYLSAVSKAEVGKIAKGVPYTVTATGLKPGSVVTVTMYSDPVVLGETQVDENGNGTLEVALPANVEPGVHVIVVSGITPDGSPVESVSGLEIDGSGVVISLVNPTETFSGAPNADEIARAAEAGVPLYDSAANVGATAAAAVAAMVVSTLAGAGGGGGSSQQKSDSQQGDSESASTQRDTSSQGEISGVETTGLKAVTVQHVGRGDKSFLWRLPGHASLHSVLTSFLNRISDKSAVLTRTLIDGHWVRAVFGSAHISLWYAGLITGVLASMSVGGHVLAPSLPFVLIIVLLSITDAFSGVLAWFGYVVSCAVSGGFTTLFDVRTAIGMGVLFIGIPLIANHSRPFRREPQKNALYVADRFADYLLAPILMAYAAAPIYVALNGLSGLQLVHPNGANTLKWAVAIAIPARMLCEDITIRLFPQRLKETELPLNKEPGLFVDMGTIVVKGGLWLLAAETFFGLGWKTWVIIGLMSFVPMLKLFADRYPNSAVVHRWFPRGVLRTVAMMFVGTWFAAWVMNAASNPVDTRSLAPVLMLPGIVVGLVDLVGRNGGAWPDTLPKRLAGGVFWIFVLGVLVGKFSI